MNTAARKLLAEFVGTFLLVFLAVGAAVFGIAAKVGTDGNGPGNGVVGVALGSLDGWFGMSFLSFWLVVWFTGISLWGMRGLRTKRQCTNRAKRGCHVFQ